MKTIRQSSYVVNAFLNGEMGTLQQLMQENPIKNLEVIHYSREVPGYVCMFKDSPNFRHC